MNPAPVNIALLEALAQTTSAGADIALQHAMSAQGQTNARIANGTAALMCAKALLTLVENTDHLTAQRAAEMRTLIAKIFQTAALINISEPVRALEPIQGGRAS